MQSVLLTGSAERKKILRQRRTSIAMVLCVAILGGVAPTAKADDKGCSNTSVQGTFAYTSTGAIASPPDIAGPFVEVGTQTFDGKGGTTGAATLSQNGNILPITVTGTYTVNSDCTGTATLQVSPIDVTVHVFFVIDDGGNEFQAIETDDGLVITRLGHRLYPGRLL